MQWLNYHHLYYFWVVVKEGSIVRASGVLRLSEPTISHQIKQLEDALGQPLFVRSGRKMALTKSGRVASRYAEKIFELGHELTETMQGRSTGQPVRFVVGIAQIIPKLLAYWLLRAVIDLPYSVRIVYHEATLERLLADLGAHDLDLVLADSAAPASVRLRVRSELLGESSVSFLACSDLARKYRTGFPRSLHGAPILLPTRASALRRSMEEWFAAKKVQPKIVGEFEDMATLKAFGEAGGGMFPIMSVMESEALTIPDVQCVGRVQSLRVKFYAVTLARKFEHPAAQAIITLARQRLAH